MTQVTVLAPVFHVYGGEHVLRREDLGKGAEQLPDSRIASLGVKKVIDPDHLKPFDKWRKQVWAIAAKRGIRIMDGFGHNPAEVSETVTEIQAVLADARKQAAFLVSDWDALVDAWAMANPQWETLIRKGAPDRAWVRSRFEFGIHAYPLALDALQDMGLAGNQLVQEMEGLGDKLVRELTTAATEMWQEFMTRPKIGKNQISPLVTMAQKAKSLAFLDARAGKAAVEIRKVLDALPSSGPYERELPDILRVLRQVAKLGLPAEPEIPPLVPKASAQEARPKAVPEPLPIQPATRVWAF
ncbi:DUF3150 domain-containing protein [Thiomonas sp.]